ncbi:hypothetical protein [Variovorax terrae]|uniref:Uncharacterized protein n=1 Tax=Variovorax terrae TaxID=2923278 RepID=A0A9X2AN95_9BURK|nr:hypothetical protein [Variovorax terrae]MCJ0764164.1 hypothetical protein [Variovorax terrae]
MDDVNPPAPLLADLRTCVEPAAGARFVGFVVARRRGEDGRYSRFAQRFDAPGLHASERAAKQAAEDLVLPISRGEVTVPAQYAQKKFEGYRLRAHALYDIGTMKWQGRLEIKKLEPPRQGDVQHVGGEGSPFAANQFAQRDRAIGFAIEHGERMVLGLVQGLKQ